MRTLFSTLPNQLTAARLVLLPVMWVLAFLHLPFYIGIGIFISFVTDVLDGYVARRLNQVSESGSKLDSVADNLLILSGLVWLWLFRPAIYLQNLVLCAVALTVWFSSLLVGAIKFKRFANLHLYSSKVAGVAMYLFMSSALIIDRYVPLLFHLTAPLFILASLETLLLQLISPHVDEHMGSILLVWRRRRASRRSDERASG